MDAIKSSGLYKNERVITSKQGAEIDTTSQKKVLNFCANNYLVLSSNDEIIEAELAQEFAKKLLEEGIYLIGFFFPVLPKEKGRIRVQLSAAHDLNQIKTAVDAFVKVGKELKVI